MSWLWRAVHGIIIAVLLVEGLYCLGQLVFVLQPPGVVGPLFGAAAGVDHELLVARRLYAIEGWIALVGLAVYLGLTEVGPRMRARREPPGQ